MDVTWLVDEYLGNGKVKARGVQFEETCGRGCGKELRSFEQGDSCRMDVLPPPERPAVISC